MACYLDDVHCFCHDWKSVCTYCIWHKCIIINQTLMFLNKTGLTTVYRLDRKTQKVDKTEGASDKFPIKIFNFCHMGSSVRWKKIQLWIMSNFWACVFKLAVIFATNFCDEFLRRIFVTNCFWRFLLTYNLLTNASFRIGVPSILFILDF